MSCCVTASTTQSKRCHTNECTEKVGPGCVSSSFTWGASRDFVELRVITPLAMPEAPKPVCWYWVTLALDAVTDPHGVIVCYAVIQFQLAICLIFILFGCTTRGDIQQDKHTQRNNSMTRTYPSYTQLFFELCPQ